MERIGFLKKNKRRFGMAKRFKRQTKVDMKKGIISDEYNVEEIAQRVAEEEIEIAEVIQEDKEAKEKFLISKGLHERPNSHMAITAWEEYKAS
jgi:hypothetical protein